jgi:ABC-type amino acid transport substrate-binding protein
MSINSVVRRSVLLLVVGTLLVVLGMGLDLAGAQQIEKPALIRWKETGVIRVGWAGWYPFMSKDAKTGEVKGFLIDITKTLAEQAGMKTEFVEDSWGTFVAGLKANKFDIFASGVVTIPRALEMGFSDGYMVIPTAFMVTTDWAKAHPNINFGT